MQSSRSSGRQSIQSRHHDDEGTLRYRWATDIKITVLHLCGGDFLAAKERKRRCDGATRGVLYFVDPSSRTIKVERLGIYGSLKLAQLEGEEHPGFMIDPISFSDQPWHNTTRIPIKVRRQLDDYGIGHEEGITKVQAIDLVGIHVVTEMLRQFETSVR